MTYCYYTPGSTHNLGQFNDAPDVPWTKADCPERFEIECNHPNALYLPVEEARKHADNAAVIRGLITPPRIINEETFYNLKGCYSKYEELYQGGYETPSFVELIKVGRDQRIREKLWANDIVTMALKKHETYFMWSDRADITLQDAICKVEAALKTVDDGKEVIMELPASRERPEAMRVTQVNYNGPYYNVESFSNHQGRWIDQKTHRGLWAAMTDCLNWYPIHEVYYFPVIDHGSPDIYVPLQSIVANLVMTHLAVNTSDVVFMFLPFDGSPPLRLMRCEEKGDGSISVGTEEWFEVQTYNAKGKNWERVNHYINRDTAIAGVMSQRKTDGVTVYQFEAPVK